MEGVGPAAGDGLEAGPREDPGEPTIAVRHPMGVASERTGLPATVLRSWEARYRAVVPDRTEGGHRLYSQEDVRRLVLLRRLTERGHRISSIARLPTRALSRMLTGEGSAQATDRIHEAVRGMDTDRVDAELRRAALELPSEDFVARVLLPLLEASGPEMPEMLVWPREGDASVGERYLALQRIRAHMDWLADALRGSAGPGLVAVRPVEGSGAGPSLLDDLSARLLSVIAAQEGWVARIVGLELPSTRLRETVATMGPRAVLVTVPHLVRGRGPGRAEVEDELDAAWTEWRLLDGLEVDRVIVRGGPGVGASGPGDGGADEHAAVSPEPESPGPVLRGERAAREWLRTLRERAR